MARIKTDKDVTRREVITKAAASLFREKGYKAASMRDLAVKVGVEAASLYNHIRSKTELLHDVCFNIANLYWEHMGQVETSTATAHEKVERLLRFHIHQMVDNYEEVYVSDREWRHLAEPYLSNYKNQRRNYRKRFAAIIEKGIDQNEFKQIDAPTAVLIMLHAVSGIDSWHRSREKISAEALEENMVTLLIEGLKK
ncbi:transcriptional regulator, TetR family [Filimonas lacunae]|uniref:Transcriptional regulator, TetR family n=1 Tax=Filimonas lacunae TaxID=477680 RepID=A0A173MNU9_9BACT|nr:TetR/AcrR family transcriptional regulator [Filimonas lacunae]BAV09314.1 transcriptional regulator, TetR family [Filimonas lacunae]SIS70971.1 transcriptional regulator, TetR family [Filimonas lacunae]